MCTFCDVVKRVDLRKNMLFGKTSLVKAESVYAYYNAMSVQRINFLGVCVCVCRHACMCVCVYVCVLYKYTNHNVNKTDKENAFVFQHTLLSVICCIIYCYLLMLQCKRWGSVEWYHDMDKYELQSRVAAATLFVHWCSENTSVRQKASLAML